jgi:hypothetical protein
MWKLSRWNRPRRDTLQYRRRPSLLGAADPAIPELAATDWMIVNRDLRRAACVRAAIDWVKAVFAEQQDVLAGIR